MIFIEPCGSLIRKLGKKYVKFPMSSALLNQEKKRREKNRKV
jgi:hypothetical protein